MINEMVLNKPAQIGEHPGTGNTEGKACLLILNIGLIWHIFCTERGELHERLVWLEIWEMDCDRTRL